MGLEESHHNYDIKYFLLYIRPYFHKMMMGPSI
jgi:hypothetical protein